MHWTPWHVNHIRPQISRMYGSAAIVSSNTIPITTTPCRFGGRRFWFKCPFVCDGQACGRRVGRVYLPRGEKIFGCRICHNLIHRSAREHDARQDRLLRDPKALAAANRSKSFAKTLMVFKAMRRRAERERKRWDG